MPARHRRSPGAFRSPRRKLVWCTRKVTISSAVATPNTVIDLLSDFRVAGGSTLGATVMRQHIGLLCTWPAQGNGFNLGLSIIRLSDVGGSRPMPSLDPEIDWMLSVQRTTTFAIATEVAHQFDFDVRSKRKVEELDQTLALSFEAAVSATMTSLLWTRVLLALP